MNAIDRLDMIQAVHALLLRQINALVMNAHFAEGLAEVLGGNRGNNRAAFQAVAQFVADRTRVLSLRNAHSQVATARDDREN